ncbi:hypothetical protein DEO72_LG8g1875 [Vigna unguiculata]|uniref:Uncharacterized protein n=1 Tax=Vigna unguiculata TaxID=3917 RepID=A0A4D6MQS3_VIGUN|nr:hypothetical protein DEO72_LG8g1875 [Vigna unguiculata]
MGRIPMDMVTKVREDPLEEIVKSSWQAKAGYEWVAADVRNQSSLFRWSRLLKSWLNCTPIVWRDVRRDIVSLEQAFLYFYDTRPRHPTTWFSLVSRSSINRLDTFTQSFKHFKDGFFKLVVKESGRPYFYNDDGSTKFPFSWTDYPWLYKDMKIERLSVEDKEVVETLMKFNDRLPSKGLIRVYNLVHPIVDIEVISFPRFDVNKDVVDGELVSKAGSCPEEEAKKAKGPDANIDDALVVDNVDGETT